MGELLWELDVAVVAYLGDHDNAFNFFDLRVIFGGSAVNVTCDLDAQVGDGDEAFKDVFGHDVGEVVGVVGDVVRGDIDIVGAGAEVRGCDGAGPPFGFGGEGGLLELGSGSDDNFFTVDVLGFGRDSGELLLLLLLLLDLGGLLTLHGGGRYLHTKDNVSNLGLG